MRTLVIVGLVAGAVAVFCASGDQGARGSRMRSVAHGFEAGGIGREVAHNMFGHHRW